MIAVDLTNGDRTILSDGSSGTGRAFDSLQSVAVGGANDRAPTLDSAFQAMFMVNLAPGAPAERAVASK